MRARDGVKPENCQERMRRAQSPLLNDVADAPSCLQLSLLSLLSELLPVCIVRRTEYILPVEWMKVRDQSQLVTLRINIFFSMLKFVSNECHMDSCRLKQSYCGSIRYYSDVTHRDVLPQLWLAVGALKHAN